MKPRHQMIIRRSHDVLGRVARDVEELVIGDPLELTVLLLDPLADGVARRGAHRQASRVMRIVRVARDGRI